MNDTELKEVVGQITELTNLVKERGDTKELDREQLIKDFEGLLEKQRQSLLDEIPQRAGEASEKEVKAASQYTGKYAREVKEISETGVSKIGNFAVTAFDLWMAKQLLDRGDAMKRNGVAIQGADKLRPASEDLTKAVKTLTASGSGSGDELVPTNMANDLWQDFFTASLIAADLPNQPMPTDPFDVPLGLGDVTWRKGGEAAATTSTDVATSKSILTSTEQIAEVNWSYNLDEDAVVAMMPALRQRLVISGGEQMDAFVLNADSTATSTGNINLDDDTPAADAYYLTSGQDGIRHLPIVDNTGQANSGGGDALADADIVGMLNDLDKYGTDLRNVRIVPGIATYFAMLGLTNVVTVDKYGPAATVIKGELASYRGIPILPSSSMPLTESDYKACKTPGSNTLGCMVAYNRNFWRVGFRRGLLIEVDRNIQTRQLIMVVSFRIAVAAHGTRSSAKHTALVGNFLV